MPQMWRRLTNPDILIYLDVSFPLTIQRRNLDWTLDEYTEQLHRLDHAREHADLYVNTSTLSPSEVLERVVDFIQGNQVGHSH